MYIFVGVHCITLFFVLLLWFEGVHFRWFLRASKMSGPALIRPSRWIYQTTIFFLITCRKVYAKNGSWCLQLLCQIIAVWDTSNIGDKYNNMDDGCLFWLIWFLVALAASFALAPASSFLALYSAAVLCFCLFSLKFNYKNSRGWLKIQEMRTCIIN